MDKLYPPSIEGKLPAFTGKVLKVPLTMNRAVTRSQVKGFQAIIKTVQTGVIKEVVSGSFSDEANVENNNYAVAVFNLVEDYTIGQYDKV